MNLSEIFERKSPPPKYSPKKSIRALFIKVAHDDGSHNREDSEWRIRQDGKIIAQITVKELTSGTDLNYKSVATAEFGKLLLKEMRKFQ